MRKQRQKETKNEYKNQLKIAKQQKSFKKNIKTKICEPKSYTTKIFFYYYKYVKHI